MPVGVLLISYKLCLIVLLTCVTNDFAKEFSIDWKITLSRSGYLRYSYSCEALRFIYSTGSDGCIGNVVVALHFNQVDFQLNSLGLLN